MSERILSPRRSSGVGLLIQCSRDGGTQARSRGKFSWISLLIAQNLAKFAFDSASAMVANGVEHLSIFAISTDAPRPAATREIAIAILVDNWQERLYPFLKMKTDAALSTQNLIGQFLAQENPAEIASSGPTSSSADMHLPMYLPFIFVLFAFFCFVYCCLCY